VEPIATDDNFAAAALAGTVEFSNEEAQAWKVSKIPVVALVNTRRTLPLVSVFEGVVPVLATHVLLKFLFTKASVMLGLFYHAF